MLISFFLFSFEILFISSNDSLFAEEIKFHARARALAFAVHAPRDVYNIVEHEQTFIHTVECWKRINENTVKIYSISRAFVP